MSRATSTIVASTCWEAVFSAAVRGLVDLEPDPEWQLDYVDFLATIPNRSVPSHLWRWQRLETEKRRMITEPAPATRWRQSSLPIKPSAAGC